MLGKSHYLPSSLEHTFDSSMFIFVRYHAYKRRVPLGKCLSFMKDDTVKVPMYKSFMKVPMYKKILVKHDVHVIGSIGVCTTQRSNLWTLGLLDNIWVSVISLFISKALTQSRKYFIIDV